MDQKVPQFQGFYTPNSTAVPDNFFDELLADLSGAEVKVVCYVMRRTFGFKRQSDEISIRQMLYGIVKKDGTRLDRGTGLSKPTLLRALRSLKERRVLLTVRNSSVERGDEATSYRLNIIGEAGGKKMTHGGEVQNFTTPLVKNFNPPVVKKLYPQDTGKQNTENNVNVNKERGDEAGGEEPKTDIRRLPNLEIDKAEIEAIAKDIVKELGDHMSFPFYYLVASKVPENVIRHALSDIRQGGARYPARVFTSRMKTYAADTLRKQTLHSLYVGQYSAIGKMPF